MCCHGAVVSTAAKQMKSPRSPAGSNTSQASENGGIHTTEATSLFSTTQEYWN